MTQGRRPNGLCGAAILISARIHGFRRTPGQIVKAVHVCEETIRKRLGEFKTTNTAMLSLSEFKQHEIKDKDPYKFYVEEKQFDPPQITKRPILKALKMEPEPQEDNNEQMMQPSYLKDDQYLDDQNTGQQGDPKIEENQIAVFQELHETMNR